MRRLELVNLKLWDLDLDRAAVTIRQGKGKKDRIIPLGDRTALWVRKYLDEARPGLVSEPDDKVVFLSNVGEPFSLDYLTEMVRGYVDAAEIGKRGACHLFRHTMATLMLEGGADIIQAMLGHADLKTTQIFQDTQPWRCASCRRFLGRHIRRRSSVNRASPIPSRSRRFRAGVQSLTVMTATKEELRVFL